MELFPPLAPRPAGDVIVMAIPSSSARGTPHKPLIRRREQTTGLRSAALPLPFDSFPPLGPSRAALFLVRLRGLGRSAFFFSLTVIKTYTE